MYRIISICLLFFLSASLLAQNPEHIKLDSSNAKSGTFRACADQFAGTWSRGPLDGFSNDVANQVMYLCGGDAMQLVGGRDSDLTGDPVPGTQPGIAYAFYECPPTISGPTRDDILLDPCLAEVDPPAAEGIVAARGNRFGDITINNNGNLQNLFGGGSPVQLWFAPITVDNFTGLSWEGSPAGQCIHSNVDEAFSYVYLNPIDIGDIQTVDPSSLEGSFTVSGGLPEFDGSNYTNITIELVSDPSTTGTITGSGFTHSSTVNFEVPVAGDYRIRVVDGKACPAETIVSMPRNAVNICISDPVEIPLGEDFCIDIGLSNAINIISFQFAIGWDPSILQFLSVEIINPSPISDQFDETNFGLEDEADPQSQGSLRVLWLTEASNPDGFTIIDETTVFRICFRAIGIPGDSSAINVTDLFQFNTEFTDNSNSSVDINVKNSGAKIIDPSSIQIIDRVCSSSTNQGSIEVAAFGGTGPYSIEIEPPVGVPFVFNMVQEGTFITLDNLMPGTYTVTVRDAVGGVVQIPIIVDNTNRLAVDINTAVNPSCANRSDGSISVTPTGGTEPYRYNWSNGSSGFNNIRALSSGTYQVTVTDLRGCTAIASANLFKAPLLVTLNPTNPACSGTNNGSITANATSGNPGQVFYEWSNGSFNQTIPNLGAGTYTVTVEDSRQCTATESITLVADKTVTVDVVTTAPLCAGDSSGSISIELIEVGGSPGTYNFSWNPILGDQTDTPRESTLDNIPAGSYSFVATNSEGCRVNQTVVLDNPPGMIINRVTGVSSDCEEGSSTGGITLAVSGGTGGKTYEWNDGEYMGNSLSNVSPGEYTVTVTDQNGCTADSVFYIGPFAGFEIIPESCEGNNDGAINSIIEFDDDFTITVLWSNGATTNDISGLAAGTYSITITGSSPNIPEDCILMFDVVVPVAERFTITENHIDPTCPGDADGVIRINVEGGDGPFSYQWDHTADDSNELFNQRAGTYRVQISDDSGCAPLSFEIVLNQPDLIMFSFASITGVSCSNTDCDGSAVLNLSGGSVPGGNFNVSWNGNTEIGVTTLTLTDLCFGENRVDVSDEKGCLAFSTVPIPGPDPISIDMDNSIIEDVSCNGDTDGQVQLVATGGNGVFTYDWPSLAQTGSNLSDLAPGTYNVIITDGNDCEFETEVTIGEPDPLVLVIDTDNTMSVGCSGDDDGMIALVTVGGNPGIQTYTWTPNVSTSEIATNLAPGMYTATVTDSKGCTDEVSYEIESPQPIVVDIPTPDEPLCNGLETFVEVTTATGGSGGPFRFSVNNGPLIPVGTPFPSLAGDISVQIFDARGCSLDTSFVISQPPPIIVDLGDDIEMDLGDTIQIVPVIIPDLGPYSFSWSPGMDLSCIDCQQPDAFPINSTSVTLVVTDENGCTGTDNVNLRVLKRRLVFIPTGFTPNNDGINDLLEVFTGRGVSGINHMRVYDRWGNMMFERENLAFSADGSDGWNGEYRGRAVEPGVYIYTVEVEFIDDAVLLYRGEVNIYR